LNFTWDNLKTVLGNNKYTVHKSKQKSIVPVHKFYKKNATAEYISLPQIEQLAISGKYNTAIGLNPRIPRDLGFNARLNTPPIIANSFPNAHIQPNMWINTFKRYNSYIETGLHYDITHNVLIQIQGTKTVRLYKPQSAPNLYITTYLGYCTT